MDMSPSNFEHLVQTFTAEGAEGWTTTGSNDDGVDAVVAKRTALMGGLSLIQAKCYSKGCRRQSRARTRRRDRREERRLGDPDHHVLLHDGVLGKAREHARTELIDGERLVYLIKEHLGKDVVTGIPNRPPPKRPR